MVRFISSRPSIAGRASSDGCGRWRCEYQARPWRAQWQFRELMGVVVLKWKAGLFVVGIGHFYRYIFVKTILNIFILKGTWRDIINVIQIMVLFLCNFNTMDTSIGVSKQILWQQYYGVMARNEIYLLLKPGWKLKLCSELRSMGVVTGDEAEVTKVISSLVDDKFRQFREAWRSVDTK